MSETVRMVAFLTHTRGDELLKPGDEFEVSETEAKKYAARKRPLGGPLDEGEETESKPAPRRKRTSAATRKKGK